MKKRNRTEYDDSRRKTKKSRITHTVAADSLPWTSTTLPDRLDDAEGFFGLEEVSDVEIVRNEDVGHVSFKIHGEVARNGDELESEDEWAGIESPIAGGDDPLDEPDEMAENKPSVTEKSKAKAKRKESSRDAKKTGKTSTLDQGHNEFAALQDSEASEVDVSAWRAMNLSSTILSSLSKLGFASPTPIQTTTIPEISAGHDVIGKAPTGSGKTIAFGIPILEHLLRDQARIGASSRTKITGSQKSPCALIISPTRELAHQLARHLIDLCSGVTVQEPCIVTITGGLSLLKQQRLLADADVIVGTPGRLWEIISQTPGMTHALEKLRFLVLDEADRLLSEGHFQEVQELLGYLEKIVNRLSTEGNDSDEEGQSQKPWQTLVFSATFQKDLQQKLVKRLRFSKASNVLNGQDSMEYLFQKLKFRDEHPKFIDVAPVSQMATNLTESILECGSMEKDLYLYSLLLQPQHQASRILIFTNSISSVRRLTAFLHHLNLPALPLHSQMPQKSRLRSLERFSCHHASTAASKPPISTTLPARQSPSMAILVATDVAARGLDIPTVNLILHYHVPRAADTYVHRSGRTARAGASGSSTLLCSPEEVRPVQRLIARVHHRNNNNDDNSHQPTAKFRLESLSLPPNHLQRVKPRVTLSQNLTASEMAKEKSHSTASFFRQAAEDLGVEYHSSGDEAAHNHHRGNQNQNQNQNRDGTDQRAKGRGRGKGRKQKEHVARDIPKEELAAMKRELKEQLGKRVVMAGSTRYLTAGGWDMEELMREAG